MKNPLKNLIRFGEADAPPVEPQMVEIPNAEIFRAGEYGDKGDYSPEDLREYAANFNKSAEPAPITVDHAEKGPAYGWLKPGSVREIGGRLLGTLQLIPEFADTVRRKMFRKRSIELYREPKSIRAVSFLGAQPPEVKGMADLAFASGEKRVSIDFQENEKPEEKQPMLTADEVRGIVKEVIKDELSEMAEARKMQEDEEAEAARKAAEEAKKDENPEEKTAMSEATKKDAERISCVEKELHETRAQLFFERSEKEVAALLDQHKDRVVPAIRPHLTALFHALPAGKDAQKISFGEGEAAKQVTPRELFAEFVGNLPEHELFSASGARSAEYITAAEARRGADPNNVELHKEVVAFAEKNKCDYTQAFNAVLNAKQSASGKNGK